VRRGRKGTEDRKVEREEKREGREEKEGWTLPLAKSPAGAQECMNLSPSCDSK